MLYPFSPQLPGKLLKCWVPYTFLYLPSVPCRTFNLIDPVLVVLLQCNNQHRSLKQQHCLLAQLLTEVSTGSYARLQLTCQPGLGSHLRLDWGRICVQVHMVAGRIQFLVGIRQRPQFLSGCQLVPPYLTLSVGSPQHGSLRLQMQQRYISKKVVVL